MHIAAQRLIVLPQRGKTALLFPGLMAPLHRIHVQHSALYFRIPSVRYIILCVKTLVSLYLYRHRPDLRNTTE